MKPVAKAVVTMAGILLTLQAPAYAQGRIPDTYMEALRKAEAALPGLAPDVAFDRRTSMLRTREDCKILAAR